MKRILAFALVLIITLSFSACGTSEKIQEKAAEKVLEKAMGGDVNVNIDGDKYTYEDKDGNKVEVGSTEWPTGIAADIIPKIDAGTITSVVNMNETCIIDIDNIEKDIFDAYLQKVKDAGFTNDAVNMDGDNGTMYQAGANDGKSIILGYTSEDKHLQISGSITQ